MDDMAEFVRAWALRLTDRRSVTGTEGEAAFGPWLAEALGAAFPTAEVWTLAAGPGDPRLCVALLVRGDGPRTVLLTGHYDTVTVSDFGPLEAHATDPSSLLTALRAQLEGAAATAAELRARADFAAGGWLPGRGLLDMKAGLAAGLAVMKAFADVPERAGNLLFMAVPDEENASAGARAAAAALGGIAGARGLELVAGVNLDAIADDGDGSDGRAIALGSIGKVLPFALVAGIATHSGFPFAGIPAGPLVGALVARMEWARELADGGDGVPPSLLSLRDGKAGYDVTTPATAFATWNVLLRQRTPEDVLGIFEALAADAAAAAMAELARRAPVPLAASEVRVLRYADVAARAEARAPGALARVDLPAGATLPEQSRRLATEALGLAGETGPVIVVGFGGIPYLATALSDAPEAQRLGRACAAAAAHAPGVRLAEVFAGISDMSFFGEGDPATLDVVAANTPVWERGIAWPATGAIAGLPIVNAGPWGRDYHTPLERLHEGYAFDVLPGLIADIVARMLDEARGAA